MLFFRLCSVKIAAGAVVCVESEIRGDVTIGKLFPITVPGSSLNFFLSDMHVLK